MKQVLIVSMNGRASQTSLHGIVSGGEEERVVGVRDSLQEHSRKEVLNAR